MSGGAECPSAVSRRAGVESRAVMPYFLPMDDTPHRSEAPAGWLEALARSEAELDAGLTVPAETVHQRIRDSIARIEAKKRAGQAAKLG
jgi:hypothetical protein